MIENINLRAPVPVKRAAKAFSLSQRRNDQTELRQYLFDDESEFENISNEFDSFARSAIKSKHMEEFNKMVPDGKATFAGIGLNQAKHLYSIIRSVKPDTVVETGVCNGVSTFVILSAMDENQSGTLYSIDYPTFSDDPAPEFQRDNYSDDHIFSAIPKNKEPGWIIPSSLTDRWNLRIGKSQRELPKLLNKLGDIDIFMHDSDHTFPCMMFEYEVAWEYLNSGGVLLSDDINSNSAFDEFGNARADQYGVVCSDFGCAVKSLV